MKTTSVALGSYFDDFIKSKIAQGRYSNASEVVRAGLRLLEENENRFMELKTAIEEGIGSGEAVGFDAQEYLKILKIIQEKSNTNYYITVSTNDFRLYNRIEVNNRQDEITSIHTNSVTVSTGQVVTEQNITPILLSSVINTLSKQLVYDRQGDQYLFAGYKSSYSLRYDAESNDYYIALGDSGAIRHIVYLHQLQNAFYMIFRKELL